MRFRKDRVNVFEQINTVKLLCEPVISFKESLKLRAAVLKIAKYRIGQVKKLSQDEAKIYDLLLKKGLNPKTVYEWLLLEFVPPHIREQLEKRTIGMRTARLMYNQWKRLSHDRLGQELMEDIQYIVRRLRWRSQENTRR